MNKEDLKNKIMSGISSFNFEGETPINEAKAFDPKNNKDHREAYNSFVKWFNRWKEKLGREEIRGLMRKVTNDALGDNLDRINESRMPGADDDHQAFDLYLWCENTREIRERDCQMAINALVRKIKLGVELDKEYLANSSMVDKIARHTIETYRNSYPNTYVSSSTRKNLRARIADMLIRDAEEEIHFEEIELKK